MGSDFFIQPTLLKILIIMLLLSLVKLYSPGIWIFREVKYRRGCDFLTFDYYF